MRPLLTFMMTLALSACDAQDQPASSAPSINVAASGIAPSVDPSAAKRFPAAAVRAAEAKLRSEAKVKDVLHSDDPRAVDWQVAVVDDGTSRVGYAQYLCQLLAEDGLVDSRTDVRIVDVDALERRPGDFRGASLGRVDCANFESLGV